MHTYILTLILFLSHGLVSTSTISAPSMEDCEASRPLIEREYQDKAVVFGKAKLTVLDAQTTLCQRIDSRAK